MNQIASEQAEPSQLTNEWVCLLQTVHSVDDCDHNAVTVLIREALRAALTHFQSTACLEIGSGLTVAQMLNSCPICRTPIASVLRVYV